METPIAVGHKKPVNRKTTFTQQKNLLTRAGFSVTDTVEATCYYASTPSSSLVKSTVSHPSSKVAPLDSSPAMKIGRATIF